MAFPSQKGKEAASPAPPSTPPKVEQPVKDDPVYNSAQSFSQASRYVKGAIDIDALLESKKLKEAPPQPQLQSSLKKTRTGGKALTMAGPDRPPAPLRDVPFASPIRDSRMPRRDSSPGSTGRSSMTKRDMGREPLPMVASARMQVNGPDTKLAGPDSWDALFFKIDPARALDLETSVSRRKPKTSLHELLILGGACAEARCNLCCCNRQGFRRHRSKHGPASFCRPAARRGSLSLPCKCWTT